MYNTTKPYNKDISDLIKQTWQTPYLSVRRHGIFTQKFSGDFEIYSHTDGIGTKGVYHWNQKTLDFAAIDALAMNLNDLVIHRATPYKMTDHILIPTDDTRPIIEIVGTLAYECKKRNIAIVHGETAIHNNIQGLEISISMDGFISNPKENRFQIGDALIGFRSNGIHSNGYTKIREIFKEEFREDFVTPTRIYSDDILKLDKTFDIHGMMHITGGAFTKLRQGNPSEPLPLDADALIRKDHTLKPQEIFFEISKKGVEDKQMYNTFNCGIGFVMSVPKKDAKKIIQNLDAQIIGEVVSGTGKIKIESMFSDAQIKY